MLTGNCGYCAGGTSAKRTPTLKTTERAKARRREARTPGAGSNRQQKRPDSNEGIEPEKLEKGQRLAPSEYNGIFDPNAKLEEHDGRSPPIGTRCLHRPRYVSTFTRARSVNSCCDHVQIAPHVKQSTLIPRSTASWEETRSGYKLCVQSNYTVALFSYELRAPHRPPTERAVDTKKTS